MEFFLSYDYEKRHKITKNDSYMQYFEYFCPRYEKDTSH